MLSRASTRPRGLLTVSSSVTWNSQFTSSAPLPMVSRNVSRLDAFNPSGPVEAPSARTSPSITGRYLSEIMQSETGAPSLPAQEWNPRTVEEPSSKNAFVVSPITTFASFSEFLATLDHHQEDLAVVLYAASFCKLCQRATMVYKQLANKCLADSSSAAHHHGTTDAVSSMRFYRLEVEPHDALARLKPLGINKFPFVQIYWRGDCVASFSTGPSHLFRKKVDDTIQVCASRTPEGWQEVCRAFGAEIQDNHRVRNELRQQLEDEPPTARGPFSHSQSSLRP